MCRMPDYLEIVPVVATGLFAGAALGISVGDQPARECIDPQAAREQFAESYKRVAKTQVGYAASRTDEGTRLHSYTETVRVSFLVTKQAERDSIQTYCTFPVQASFAVIGAASSAWLAYKGGPSRSLNITSAVLMAAMLPWTLVVIMPTNDTLRFKKDISDSEVEHIKLPCSPSKPFLGPTGTCW